MVFVTHIRAKGPHIPFIYLQSRETTMKLQSAMEYLMTYGWAILVIAIVTIALFKLNVFNPNYWSPKLQPGSCSVIRKSYGSASLSSGCLINAFPKFVAQIGSSNSLITFSFLIPSTFLGSETMSAWVDPRSVSSRGDVINAYGAYLNLQNNGEICFYQSGASGAYTCSSTTNVVETNTWVFITATYNQSSGLVNLYLNGYYVGSATIGTSPTNVAGGSIGYCSYCGVNQMDFNGLIANVQVYNTTLSANSVEVLYTEGIGGIPINLKNLVGWWPLNDDANDYSGNNNYGIASNVFYTANWENGYTAPA